jgi:hypothetical protein
MFTVWVVSIVGVIASVGLDEVKRCCGCGINVTN